jgi:rhodanese-related sulfurtransferase
MDTQTLDVEQLKSRIAEGKTTLLDVRRKSDYEAAPATIPGAIWRDPEQIDQWRSEVSDSVVLYCVRGGSVSQSVCKQLSEAGIDATYLEGGLAAWTVQGEPVK